MLSVLIYAILILNDGLFLLFTFLNLVFTVCSSEHCVCPPPSAPRSLHHYHPVTVNIPLVNKAGCYCLFIIYFSIVVTVCLIIVIFFIIISPFFFDCCTATM